jgi:hypothetical protein
MITIATPASSQPDHSQPEPTPSTFRILIAIGVLLFLAGATLPLILAPHLWFAVARWAGLTAIAAGGWRKP